MSKYRILLVDDETDILAELSPFLQHEGYVAETAVFAFIVILAILFYNQSIDDKWE